MAPIDPGSATTSSESGPSGAGSATSPGKPRSCAVCARRKVRCDKRFPCGRCVNAGIECTLPAIDERPRWARRLMQDATEPTSAAGTGGGADALQARLHMLETLVRDLQSELSRARTVSSATVSTGRTSPHTSPPRESVQAGTSGQREDLSSTFWTRVGHELEDLEDAAIEAGQRQHEEQHTGPAAPNLGLSHAMEIDRQPMTGLSFASGPGPQALSTDPLLYYPLASQVPYLIEVFTERVYSVIAFPHLPGLKKLVRRGQGRQTKDYSAEEAALLFAIFYAAICSLDDDEVVTSFNSSKAELASTYRRGLEAALSTADFLSNPSDNVLQALVIFLSLGRLHDESKYLWMMTGVAVRMARFLRYHEDGATSKKISPFQTEMRRRLWWNIVALDMRATEDQGTELATPEGSFTTKLPSNVDDGDLSPDMERAPREQAGMTNVCNLRLCATVARATQRMIAAGSSATVDSQVQLIDALAAELDNEFFALTNATNRENYLAAAGTMRVFMGRLTLLAFLPALFASSGADFTAQVRNKMLIAAIEMTELNHGLNIHPSCQAWRWVYQTQQHWHAVVFILLEVCRRPWSAMMERAWLSLQSPWLLTARAATYSNPSVWVPLKSLMQRARRHRVQELARLKQDPGAAELLDRQDQEQMPIPSSSVTFPDLYNEEMFRRSWWQAVNEVTASASSSSTGRPTSAGGHLSSDSTIRTRHSGGFQAIDNSAYDVRLDPPRERGDAHAGEPSLGTLHPASGVGSLDDFLNADAITGSFDDMDDVHFSDFDWNGWFESAAGSL